MKEKRRIMKTFTKTVSCLIALLMLPAFLPVLPAAKAETAHSRGETIELGAYPQTPVADGDLTAALDALAEDLPWLALGYTADPAGEYAFYREVTLSGRRYRAIRFTQYNSEASQTRYGYMTNTVYWFRYEPIEWTLLDPDSGLLIADRVLDTQAVNFSVYGGSYADEAHTCYLNNYAHSALRAWLNGLFRRSAFSDDEAALLILNEQDNGLYDMGDPYARYACENTRDPVFLLSYFEAGDEAMFPDDESRVRVGTDYARAMGATNYHYQNPDVFPDNDYWFLRSPGANPANMGYVGTDGRLYADMDCDHADVGVCPAVYLDLDAYDRMRAADPDGPDEPDTPDAPPAIAYTFENGVLTCGGSGEIPAAGSDNAPPAAYAAECRAVILEEGIGSVAGGAFAGYRELAALVVNGTTTLQTGAFTDCPSLETAIAKAELTAAPGAFGEYGPTVYYPAKTPPKGEIPPGAVPYRFEDGTVYFGGRVLMDIYTLLDVTSVLCGLYENVQKLRFDSFTAQGFSVYTFDEGKHTWVRAKRDTLDNASFTVQLPAQDGWRTVTFNEFCRTAAADTPDSFRLAAETESGETVKETVFQVFFGEIREAIQRALKWIVGILNALFNLLTRFRKL